MNTPKPPGLDLIRVETALSRFPVHRLSKGGTVAIEIHESKNGGETSLKWEVSHNSRHRQPGPLAYKVDTLVVARRLEEVGRPVPKLVRLGSLRVDFPTNGERSDKSVSSP
jgi:hypothetical protein